jgi:hypothetical protein
VAERHRHPERDGLAVRLEEALPAFFGTAGTGVLQKALKAGNLEEQPR